MRHVTRSGVALVLIWAFLATGHVSAQGPTGSPATRRLVVFEAFIRVT